MKKNNETEENIEVQLLSINSDVKVLNDVSYIKIKSKKYNLIIMKDYLPIIGEIEGHVEIGMNGESFVLDNVEGYYMHKHNKFHLFYVQNIIEEEKE